MVRSVLAVIAGYLVFAVSAILLFRLSGHDPHAPAEIGFVLVTIVYGMLFATLAGFLAALLGKRFEMEHALAVASLIASSRCSFPAGLGEVRRDLDPARSDFDHRSLRHAGRISKTTPAKNSRSATKLSDYGQSSVNPSA